MKIKNENLDRFAAQMMRLYVTSSQNDLPASPYFMIRLRTRIREHQSMSLLWETSIVRARHWLLGLSFIALIFFISNLVVKPTTQPLTTWGLTSEAIAFADAEWEGLLSPEEARKD